MTVIQANKPYRTQQIQMQPIDDDQSAKQSKVDSKMFFGLLTKVGAWGKYQILVMVILSAVNFFNAAFTFNLPYLFYQDHYACSEQYQGQTCSQHVCSLSPQERIPFIPASWMHSLADQYGDYRCPNQKLRLDAIQTMNYLGKLLGAIVMTLCGDRLSIKKQLLGNLIVGWAALLALVFSPSLTFAGGCMLVASLGLTNMMYLSFVVVSEIVEESRRPRCVIILEMFYGLGVLSNVPAFYLTRNWRHVVCFTYIVPFTIMLVLSTLFLKDTPMSLVINSTPQKAYHDLLSIGKLNKIRQPDLSLAHIVTAQNRYRQSMINSADRLKRHITVLDLFKFRSLRVQTALLMLIEMSIVVMFLAPALMLDTFKMNLFVNGLVVGVSEFICYPLSFFLASRCPRKIIAYTAFLVTAVCATILLFIWDQSPGAPTPSVSSGIGLLFLIFIFRFAISNQFTFFFVYFGQLYPTQARLQISTLISFVGNLTISVVPLLNELCLQKGFPIIVLFIILSVFGLAGSKFLPETLNKGSYELVEEMRTSEKETKDQDVLQESLISKESEEV